MAKTKKAAPAAAPKKAAKKAAPAPAPKKAAKKAAPAPAPKKAAKKAAPAPKAEQTLEVFCKGINVNHVEKVKEAILNSHKHGEFPISEEKYNFQVQVENGTYRGTLYVEAHRLTFESERFDQ